MVFGLVLLVGLALAGAATYMAKNYIETYQNALAKERQKQDEMVKLVDVFIAAKPLKYGDAMTTEDVKQVKWPENAIPEGAFLTTEELFPFGDDKPRYVLRAMEVSEAVMAVKVTEPGEDAGLTSRLERGMRAFAIKVDVASGVSGFLRPGDRVDVYWTGRIEKGDRPSGRGEVTKLIEAGVKLIAIDQRADGDTAEATIARTVTVAATPKQVAALAQAQSTGRLSLSLVGSDDDIVAEAIEGDQRSLLGITEEAVSVTEQKEEKCTIRTRRGAEVVEIPIPCTN